MIEIRTASENDINSIKELWKSCFEDTDEAVNLFLKRNLKNAYLAVDGELMSMLFMLPAKINGRTACYLYAAATAKQYRGLGLMHGLIQSALANTGAELCVTLPASDELYGYYRKLGFFELTSNTARLSRAEVAELAKPHEVSELVVNGYCGIRNRVLRNNFLFWDNEHIELALEYNALYGAKIIRSNYGYAIAEAEENTCYVKEFICDDMNAPFLLTDLLSSVDCESFVFHLSPNQKFIESKPERFAMVKYVTRYRPDFIYTGLTLD